MINDGNLFLPNTILESELSKLDLNDDYYFCFADLNICFWLLNRFILFHKVSESADTKLCLLNYLMSLSSRIVPFKALFCKQLYLSLVLSFIYFEILFLACYPYFCGSCFSYSLWCVVFFYNSWSCGVINHDGAIEQV